MPRIAASSVGCSAMSGDGGVGEQRPLTFALVIPTHQRVDLVAQAVDSALRQSRAFDQIVVVTDGIGDPATAALSDRPIELAAIDKAGVAAARNAGVALTRTDWVLLPRRRRPAASRLPRARRGRTPRIPGDRGDERRILELRLRRRTRRRVRGGDPRRVSGGEPHRARP